MPGSGFTPMACRVHSLVAYFAHWHVLLIFVPALLCAASVCVQHRGRLRCCSHARAARRRATTVA